jgi:tubulin beta
MSSLFVQIGQCGCQIGVPLNSKLSSCYYCTRVRPPNRMHSIMVDTEPKVIKQILNRQPKWLDPANVKYFQYGRGNNWSYGYLHHLPEQPLHTGKGWEGKQFSHLEPTTIDKYLEENKQIADYVIERIRRELENTDCAMAINVLGSLGGGTGSGLGTKIVECIREEFNISTYSHLVLPNKSGESPLQVYNCLLSLSSLQEHSSAIFTYENDKIMSLFQKTEQKESTLDSINDHLASNIARMIKINELPNYGRFYSQMVSECVLSPELKFLNLFGGDNKNGKWEEVIPRMIEEVRNYQND